MCIRDRDGYHGADLPVLIKKLVAEVGDKYMKVEEPLRKEYLAEYALEAKLTDIRTACLLYTSFSDGSKTILLTVDSTSATIGSQTYTMGYAPYIENQRTFVHVRFVAEAFDCQVSWDQSAKRVDINR